VPTTRLDTARIRAARRAIDPIFLDTPVYRTEALESVLGCTLSIKLETANPVRCFKARGTELVASLLVDDDAVLVQEASIVAGMRLLLEHAGLVVEPSAALGIAAILEDRDRFAGRQVVTIVCGSNVDVDSYRRWVGDLGAWS